MNHTDHAASDDQLAQVKAYLQRFDAASRYRWTDEEIAEAIAHVESAPSGPSFLKLGVLTLARLMHVTKRGPMLEQV